MKSNLYKQTKACIKTVFERYDKIVFCKNCKYYDAEFKGKGFGDCTICGLTRADEDFCSYGERKENANLFTYIPFFTIYYKVDRMSKNETKVIDGETYTRKIPYYYVVSKGCIWKDVNLLKLYLQREEKIFLNIEDARAAAKELNEGKNKTAEFLNKKLNIPDTENLESEIQKEAPKSVTHFENSQIYNRFIKGV